MNSRRSLIILLAVMTGCGRASSLADVPKPVFVPSGGRDLRVSDGVARGQIDVAYRAEEKYPAPQVRQGMAARLRASGYQPLDHDFLDPTQKLEVPREWDSYTQNTRGRETCVQEVVEDWQNAQGDIVRYSLRYDSPCEAGPVRRGEPTTTTLRVTVGMIPAAAVRSTLEVLRKSGANRQ